jgi:hypothetical protein
MLLGACGLWTGGMAAAGGLTFEASPHYDGE